MILIANQIELRDEVFYRVHIIRGGHSTTSMHSTTSILSVLLARRILPKLLDRWGVAESDRAGMFRGSIICSPAVETWPVVTPFREEDCGGAFDGFCVTSDADGGL